MVDRRLVWLPLLAQEQGKARATEKKVSVSQLDVDGDALCDDKPTTVEVEMKAGKKFRAGIG